MRITDWALCLLFIAPFATLNAQEQAVTDTVINRNVVVEREYQPTVKSAGKINVKPELFTPQVSPVSVTYSNYSHSLSVEENIDVLGFTETHFQPENCNTGFLRGGLGHSATQFDFTYRVDAASHRSAKKNEGTLELYAHHLGQWGRKTLEKSSLGLNYNHVFRGAQLYFGAEGGSEYFTHYYRYINDSTKVFNDGVRLKDFTADDKQAFWTANAFLGVQNVPGAKIQYRVQAGYEGFYAPSQLTEHQIHTNGMFDWSSGKHHAGLELDAQDRIYNDAVLSPKHLLHFEPYYQYDGKRFRIHAGVNLDVALGGYNRTFGASPNIQMEGDITTNWLSFFLDARGDLKAEGFRGELQDNRFLDLTTLKISMNNGCCAAYTPVDAVAGFRFRPHPDLLFDVHGGYAYTFNEHIWGYDKSSMKFAHFEQDQQLAKVGASLHYHYQDVFSMNISGDYFFHYGRELTGQLDLLTDELTQGDFTNESYNHPQWQIRARFDGRINKRWSLYSDNYFYGKRHALLLESTVPAGAQPIQPAQLDVKTEELKPVFDLNFGVQFNLTNRLSFYGQLNNYLAWTRFFTYDVLYNTPAQGVNCLFGVTWSF